MCGVSRKGSRAPGWREGPFRHNSDGAGAGVPPKVMSLELNTGERHTKEVLLGISPLPPRKLLPPGS